MDNLNWQFNGLPLHVLFIHFVVIVVPLAALCLLLGAAWPAARRRLGLVTPIIALAALISVPFTVQAGEWLQDRVAETALSELHTEMGEDLLPWSLVVFFIAVVQWAAYRFVLNENARFSSSIQSKGARLAVVLVIDLVIVVSAIGSTITVFLIGESGVRAVWAAKALLG
jgi:hypothetical protein